MLDMYREEALAARQERAYGGMLHVRPYLLKCSPILLLAIAATLGGFLMSAQHASSVRIAVKASAAATPGAGIVLAVSQRGVALRPGQRAILHVNQAGGGAPVHGRLATVAAPASGAGDAARLLFVADAAGRERLRGLALSAAPLNLQVETGRQALGVWLAALLRQRPGKEK